MEVKHLTTNAWEEELARLIATPSIPATRKWLKRANEKEREAFFHMMKDAEDQQFPLEQSTISTTLRPEVLPSVKHWMENATNEEREAVMKLFRALSRTPKSGKTVGPQNGNSHDNGTNIITRSTHQTPSIKNANRHGKYDTTKQASLSRSKYAISGKMESFSDQNGGYHWRFKLPPVPPNTNGTFIYKESGKVKPTKETPTSNFENKRSSPHFTPLARPTRAEFDIAPDWRMNRKLALKELRRSFAHSDKESAIINDY